jgi:hypothetical protein
MTNELTFQLYEVMFRYDRLRDIKVFSVRLTDLPLNPKENGITLNMLYQQFIQDRSKNTLSCIYYVREGSLQYVAAYQLLHKCNPRLDDIIASMTTKRLIQNSGFITCCVLAIKLKDPNRRIIFRKLAYG